MPYSLFYTARNVYRQRTAAVRANFAGRRNSSSVLYEPGPPPLILRVTRRALSLSLSLSLVAPSVRSFNHVNARSSEQAVRGGRFDMGNRRAGGGAKISFRSFIFRG